MDQDAFNSFTIQQLSVFGLGKLGLPLAALFAQNGLRTVGIDVDIALVEKLRTGTIPLLEPGLEALLAAAAPKINYTTDARAAADTDASIIVVSTPYDFFACGIIEHVCRRGVSLRRAPRRSGYRSGGRSQIRLLPIPRQ